MSKIMGVVMGEEYDYYFEQTVYHIIEGIKRARLFTINKRDSRLTQLDETLKTIEKQLEVYRREIEAHKKT